MTDNNKKTIFVSKALANAATRIESRFSDSTFSFEKTTNPSPVISNIKINSSAKFVVLVTNVLVRRKEEYISKTGILNLKLYPK